MKRLLVPVLAAAALVCVAAPASAQGHGPRPGGQGIQLRQRADQLEMRIRNGVRDRSLDQREADRALAELNDIRRMEADLLARNRGFLTQPDRLRISVRLDQLERGIHWLRNNGERGGRPGGGFAYGFGGDFWRGAPQRLEDRAGWLETRIRDGERDGSLTRPEGARAEMMLRDFRRSLADLTLSDGGRLRRINQEMLAARLDNISMQIRWLRANDRRY